MNPNNRAALHIVILAAGASTRFGSPKQLARVGGHPLLQQMTMNAVEVAASAVTVVLGAHANEITPMLRRSSASIVINRDWAEGIASSIRAGVKSLSGVCAGALILLADQAMVTAEDLKRLSNAWRRAPTRIAAASYSGTVGVPAVFPRAHFGDLLALRGDSGARMLLQRDLSQLTRVPMPSAALDLDTPEALLLTKVSAP
jgi:molybdenum cofactor cytidylyltransferase